MIPSIKLTVYGDTLVPCTPYVADVNDLPGGDLAPLGGHEVCGGPVTLHRISETHRAIVCRACALRVPIANTVRTFGDLRMVFSGKQRGGNLIAFPPREK